jgi:hypothetical protein
MKRRGAHSRDKVTASAGEESPDRRVILPGRAPKPAKTGSRSQRHERCQFQKRAKPAAWTTPILPHSSAFLCVGDVGLGPLIVYGSARVLNCAELCGARSGPGIGVTTGRHKSGGASRSAPVGEGRNADPVDVPLR